ncbi:UPF0488 protein C8orf33 homolog [Ahaetulla prasina]|uniref:UPF0488 protein C8orf33 homolog n=1 Tax=Ahaetulla prasina TaxID=499056 RepID=UPI0026470E42|nr:UPF0488 protein C8orf33 homolog [Ahaetulla prasina]XP_058013626.1 UPF0488 protein C8orf33 homolog [Ahaetulla prasina]XP_058013627.1 UPF0488 protein C8orf33 homolog [Ahaetulla prasina]XP_058013628.1 UPF0488 protein C8orf33 homolog [Ahaetulla prasina]XP_058013629.1 UPF0488 protein C8orf33 homolog [Ahaetulla prasina]
MEEAPKPTFQDELEWCITQLETGLLRLNPTPKQADETRHILKVLRSRKAPLVKKRQMMHHVFGDYRLKMAEENERTAKAGVTPMQVEIQQGNSLPLGSVVYRKQQLDSPSSASTSLLASSDNSFQFNFVLPEGTTEETDRSAAEEHGLGDSREQSIGNGPSRMLDVSTGTQQPGFAFNFTIPDASGDAFDPGSGALAEAAPERDLSSKKTTVTTERSASSQPDRTDGKDCVSRHTEGHPVKEVPRLEATEVASPEVAEEKLVVAAGGPPKRRKKKKPPLSKVSHVDKGRGDSKLGGEGTSEQAEMLQAYDQLKREVDWCVEQLELGLKTQKSSPKQTEEALRAIKTLRSKKAVLAKKRQVMRLMFGDYRAKMEEERQKQLKLLQAASKAAHITEVNEETRKKRSQVFRKSAEGARAFQNLPEPSCCQPPACLRSTDPSSFKFRPSQGEFCFNFF